MTLDRRPIIIESGADAFDLGVEALFEGMLAFAGGAQRRPNNCVSHDGRSASLARRFVVEALLLGGVTNGDDREALELSGEVRRFLEA